MEVQKVSFDKPKNESFGTRIQILVCTEISVLNLAEISEISAESTHRVRYGGSVEFLVNSAKLGQTRPSLTNSVVDFFFKSVFFKSVFRPQAYLNII
jgi:hypothetical protein